MQGDFHASVVAPLHNLMMIGVFRLVKCSLKSVRMVSVIFSIGILLAFWATVRQWYGEKTALIALGLIATSAPFLFYNRLGLLETPALFWLIMAFWQLSKSSQNQENNIFNLVLIGFFAAISTAWKSTFILGVIPLFYGAWMLSGKKSLITFAAYLITMILFVAIFIAPNYAEYARCNQYYLFHQYLPHSFGTVWFNLHRGLFTGEDDGELPYLATRLTAPALLALAYLLLNCKPGTLSNQDKINLAWIVAPIAVFLFSSYTPSRYLMIVFPPIAIFAACAVVSLKNQNLVAPLTGLAILFNLVLFGLFWIHRTYTIRDSSALVQHVLPHDAWIMGQFGPELCLNNNLRSMYIQKGLANDSPDVLTQLPITHVLATQTESPDSDPWTGKYTQLIGNPGGLKTIKVGPYRVNVYANLFPLCSYIYLALLPKIRVPSQTVTNPNQPWYQAAHKKHSTFSHLFRV
jgi:4-amino-4-deoxy-L-arabinose transferase-like glycosyltransferase